MAVQGIDLYLCKLEFKLNILSEGPIRWLNHLWYDYLILCDW